MRVRAVLATAGILLGGCTYVDVYAKKDSAPVVLNGVNRPVTVVKHIHTASLRTFDNSHAYNLGELLASELKATRADAAVNVRLSLNYTVGCFFINLFTLGIAGAHEVEVSADLVEYGPGDAPQPQPAPQPQGATP